MCSCFISLGMRREQSSGGGERDARPTPGTSSHQPVQKTLVFSCACCEIEINVDYKGRCPPHESAIVFLEDGYFRQDPFTDRSRPLFIGADCSMCARPVCGQPTCSMFYTRRFCAACAKQNEGAFPLELKRDLDKLMEMAAAPANYDEPPPLSENPA